MSHREPGEHTEGVRNFEGRSGDFAFIWVTSFSLCPSVCSPGSLWLIEDMTLQLQLEIARLIEANRARALWHLAPDYLPRTPAETRRVLQYIAARGDRATWVRARELLRELS